MSMKKELGYSAVDPETGSLAANLDGILEAEGSPLTPRETLSIGKDESASIQSADLLRAYHRNRRRSLFYVWIIRVVSFIFVFGTWEVLVRSDVLSELFVSRPLLVIEYLRTALFEPGIWEDIGATVQGSILGLSLGFTAALLSAAAIDHWKVFGKAVDPWITIGNSIPRPAIAPIFLLWFGLGIMPKILISAIVVYFIVLVNTLGGFRSVNPDYLALTKTLGFNARQRFFKAKLPATLPSVFSALRLGAVYAVLGTVVTEMIASRNGLGQVLVVESGRFNLSGAFGVIVILAVITSLLDQTLAFINRRVGGSFEDED